MYDETRSDAIQGLGTRSPVRHATPPQRTACRWARLSVLHSFCSLSRNRGVLVRSEMGGAECKPRSRGSSGSVRGGGAAFMPWSAWVCRDVLGNNVRFLDDLQSVICSLVVPGTVDWATEDATRLNSAVDGCHYKARKLELRERPGGRPAESHVSESAQDCETVRHETCETVRWSAASRMNRAGGIHVAHSRAKSLSLEA